MKLSQYNHFATSLIAGQFLAYNALSGSFLVLDDGQLGEAEALLGAVEANGAPPEPLTRTQEQLVHGGFVVADDLGEVAVVHNRYYEGRERNSSLSLTVTLTVSCNFSCGYCFQHHSNRTMSQADVANLKAFAAERLQPGTSLSVTWFGGEPLIAFDVVQELAPYFANLAAERDCSFSHSMITNGYLLTAEKAEFLASIPGFTYAQITLDGAPHHHDQRRQTLGKAGTFDRILANIKAAARYINISIRVNVDRRNLDGLEELLHILKREGLAERVGVYLGHVWEYTEEVEESQFLSKEEFAAVQTQFDFVKFRKGYALNARLPAPKQGSQCVADHPNGFVISPNGLLFNCWNEVHLPPREASGRYDELDDLIFLDVMQTNRQRWEGYDPFTHLPCQTCSVAPLCMSGCPWESRKNAVFDTGYCTPLRFNLADQLRLFHLQTSVKQSLGEYEVNVDQEACFV